VGNYDPTTPTPGVGALIFVLATNTVVSGNILDASLGLDNYTAALLGALAPCGVIVTVGTNTTIDGNTIVGVRNGPAIVAHTPGAGALVGFSGINAVITNNTITNVVQPFIFGDTGAVFDFDVDGFNEGAAIYIFALNARIEGNTINGVSGTDGHGIFVAMPTGNAVVVGNTIKTMNNNTIDHHQQQDPAAATTIHARGQHLLRRDRHPRPAPV
jgi:hypothetical protein